jgi:ABC-type dipeptide/oligopeptide/nickel transport system permease subunit
MPTILILFIYAFGDVIMGITVLGIIQLGGPSTTITWGLDLEKAILFIPDYLEIWWPIVFPALFVTWIIIALTMLSDNIRDLTLGRESRISSYGGKK